MKFLEIIVDGYNFLMTTGLMDTKVTDIELEKGRRRLIQLLVKSFPDPEDRGRLTVVFDSATLLDLPVALEVQGVSVRFSKGYDSADELIMEMIRANAVPKRLLVVSSDHEIQTCARRRKASFIDSDQWLDELESKLARDPDGESDNVILEDQKTDVQDSEYWLNVFSDVDVTQESLQELDSPIGDSDPVQPPAGTGIEESKEKDRPSKKDVKDLEGWDDLFPPGYGEDLLE